MQTCDCTVHLGGDLRMQVRKRNVTVAEIAVLQAIHGRDSVVDIQVTGRLNRYGPVRERDRLRAIYQRNPEKPYVDQLFSGPVPVLPTKLSELVLVDGHEEEEADSVVVDAVRFDQDGAPIEEDGGTDFDPAEPPPLEDAPPEGASLDGLVPPQDEVPEGAAPPADNTPALLAEELLG